jgi:predicted SprT family Zn-dependent metalloprotease/ribosomal protein S27AE
MNDMTNWQTPTTETYMGLERAFNHFNAKLFDDRLPPVVFTLRAGRKAHGYFWAEQFTHRQDGDPTHEIAMNPATMSRELVDVLSTLVHEMTHLEQQEYGKPGKNGNHNKEWVGLMERIGLIPSNTGQPGGKKTGRQMTHYIDPNGDFLTAASELVDTGFDLPFFTKPREGAKAKKKDLSKVKRTCPCCDANAWAKQGSRLICGDCDELMIEEEV